jgi:protein-tyrosine-phosphatase
MGDALKIVTLCTGNVARSVMLGYMLETLNETSGSKWSVRTAGTHVVEGLAMSGRTRDALQRLDELGAHHYNAHRSHQLSAEDVAWADVILASEADHVRYVRSNFADHARKAVQLYQFVRHAPLDVAFDEQLALSASLEPSIDLDVADPAGGDQAVYDACAQQLWALSQAFAVLVTESEFD